MAHPPSQDFRRAIENYYQDQDARLDAVSKTVRDLGSVREYRIAANEESDFDHKKLKEIEDLFNSRQKWMKAVSCLFLPCTFPIKTLCCEPCCTPCDRPTETRVDLCWHACNPDLYFDLDLKHNREAQGLPSAEEVCLRGDERKLMESLLANCRDIRHSREWAQIHKDEKTLEDYRAGKL